MKSLLNLARPDFAFASVWLLVILAYLPFTTALTPAFNPAVAAMLAFNILTAPIVYFFVKRLMVVRRGPLPANPAPRLSALDVQVLERFLLIMCLLWSAFFLAETVYSGGIPIIWALTGDSRSYTEFGIPTVGGLANMLRSFAAIACVVLLVVTRRRTFIIIWAALFVSVLAEISRSGVFVFVLETMCVYAVLRPVRLRSLLLVTGLGALLVGAFIFLGQARKIDMNMDQLEGVKNVFGAGPVAVYWLWAYVVSPLGNLNFAAGLGIEPVHLPYFTLQPIIPTVVRSVFFPAATYPIPLISEGLNATSMYAPLVADFGFAGAAAAMTLFQGYASYSYLQAKRGDLFHLFFYPALFTAIVLSIFYIYLLNLSILLFPLVCFWMRRYMSRRQRESDSSEHGQAAHGVS